MTNKTLFKLKIIADEEHTDMIMCKLDEFVADLKGMYPTLDMSGSVGMADEDTDELSSGIVFK